MCVYIHTQYICIDCICIYTHIQGDSGGIRNTLGNDSMCDSKQKSSYELGSDFELRLVAASLKICYEMCQTSTSQGFVHCTSSVAQW
jgi:hypothetical protein